MIEVISNVALATVQDQGRLNYRHYGIGSSGVMDNLAQITGNLLLGNDINAAVIEIQIFPFEVKFTEDCDFALTGAISCATLDDLVLPPNWVSHAKRGQKLRMMSPVLGCRVYLALGGGVDVPEVLGSRSTQLRGSFGGFQGRMLKRGDYIAAINSVDNRVTNFGIDSPINELGIDPNDYNIIRAIPAAQHEDFSRDAQQSFWNQVWRVTPQSNRYGFRLQGDSIKPKQALEIRSHGIVPGVIQIPHGGQPIIQMRDAQPTGGYPKIATVIEADMWRLAQLPIGSSFSFKEVGYNVGVQALRDNDLYLESLENRIKLARMAND